MNKIVLIILVIYNALVNGWEIKKMNDNSYLLSKEKSEENDTLQKIMPTLLKNTAIIHEAYTDENYSVYI